MNAVKKKLIDNQFSDEVWAYVVQTEEKRRAEKQKRLQQATKKASLCQDNRSSFCQPVACIKCPA